MQINAVKLFGATIYVKVRLRKYEEFRKSLRIKVRT